MCLDGNSAELSSNYINAQLGALWENAQKCAKHPTGDYRSATYEKSRPIRALYEYHYIVRKCKSGLKETDLFFSAKFGRPELKFVCNHSVFLALKIESGHLNTDTADAANPGAKAKQNLNHKIESLEVVFHVPIFRSSVKGRDSRIGNAQADHLIQMQILKLEDAKLVLVNPDASLGADVRGALQFYMKHYLAFLKTSGTHVFFDLSDFDTDEDRPKSDYARIRTREIDTLLQKVQGEVKLLGKFDCNILAQFYKAKWLIASALKSSGQWGTLDLALATISSEWITGYQVEHHFFINLLEPTIEVLCPYEVILKFRIQDLAFFKGMHIDEKATILQEFHDWTIAFVVQVFENDSGMIQLNFESARFSHVDSFFGLNVDIVVEKFIKLMVDFFTVDYVDILVSQSLHLCIESGGAALGSGEHHDADWGSGSEDEESTAFVRQRGFALLWLERIQRMEISSGFDMVVTLSEVAINRILIERLKIVSLFEGKNGFFRLNVCGATIRLLSNGKAILYIQADGHMRIRKTTAERPPWYLRWTWKPATEEEESEQCSFETVTLAYEVDLKLVTHECIESQVDKSVVEYIREKTSYGSRTVKVTTEVTHSHEHALKHFVLDLTNARLLEKLSDFAVFEGGETYADKLKTIQTFVPKYFASLVAYGHNILHTVTMADELDTSSLFAFTDVDFKVITKRRVVASASLFERETVEAPIVMIYGMCTSNPLPPLIEAWGLGWLTVGKRSVGTIALSRRALLERCILRHLEGINARTTLVPQSVDVVGGGWQILLQTWEQREERLKSGHGCKWTQIASKEIGHLAYEWYHKDEWKHKHESDARVNNEEYTLECTTHNTVQIPTAYNPAGMVIKIEGKSSIRVFGKAKDEKWKNKTIFSWAATLALDTSSGYLKVNFTYSKPVLSYDRAECSGQCPLNVTELHKKHFLLEEKMFDSFIPALKTAFESNWRYCNLGIQQVALRDPIFTRKGDFVAELDIFVEQETPVFLNSEAWSKHSAGYCEYRPAPTTLVNGKSITVSTSVSGYFSNGNGNSPYGNGNGTPGLSPSASTATAVSSAAVTPALEVKPDILIPAPKLAAPMTTKVTKLDAAPEKKTGAFL